MATLGLRIDVCTFQGLRRGVLPLLDALRRRGLRASLFTTLGPDRSGLAVRRIFRHRGFLAKMLRTRAAGMYGLRTMLHGTLLPAPRLGDHAATTLRRANDDGHELGIHAWDHTRWQDDLDRLDARAVREDFERAVAAFDAALGKIPAATAAPAWLTSGIALQEAARWGFRYASDTRGEASFRPVVEGAPLALAQVPVTLPTLDEELGRRGATAADFFAGILRRLRPQALNVLCVHAESEGRVHLSALESFLDRALAGGWRIVPVGDLAPPAAASLPALAVERGVVPGRAGPVSVPGAAQLTSNATTR